MHEGVTVINTMADGSVCEDLSVYIKSPDQLPEVTKRLIGMFIENGYGILERQMQRQGEEG